MPENSANPFAEKSLGKNSSQQLDESLVTEKSIGNYQSYNYKPSYKVPKYMISKASSYAREEEDQFSESNGPSFLKAFDRQ